MRPPSRSGPGGGDWANAYPGPASRAQPTARMSARFMGEPFLAIGASACPYELRRPWRGPPHAGAAAFEPAPLKLRNEAEAVAQPAGPRCHAGPLAGA